MELKNRFATIAATCFFTLLAAACSSEPNDRDAIADDEAPLTSATVCVISNGFIPPGTECAAKHGTLTAKTCKVGNESGRICKVPTEAPPTSANVCVISNGFVPPDTECAAKHGTLTQTTCTVGNANGVICKVPATPAPACGSGSCILGRGIVPADVSCRAKGGALLTTPARQNVVCDAPGAGPGSGYCCSK